MTATAAKATPPKAQVKTPTSKTDPDKMQIEEIPLPPPEMWSELQNVPEAAKPATSEKASEQPLPRPEVAALEFETVDHVRSVPLKHPFKWEGEWKRSIDVRRLTLAEVEQFSDDMKSKPMTTFDIYALQTGLPASVLRGLIEEDGEAVTDAAFDFLPRRIRAAFDAPES